MSRGKRGSTTAQSLRKRLAVRDRDSLLRLLTAAGGSPGVRHRWPSIAYLLNLALHGAKRAGKPVALSELQSLLDACRGDEPAVARMEDFVPADPRQVVLARVGGDALRLFPGSVERPVADVARWSLVAEAIDRALMPDLGFGVRHYTELALRYTDHAITVLAPAWPEGEIPVDEPVTLTAEELSAAGRLLDTPPSAVMSSPELRKAAEWATAHVEDLPFELAHPQSSFGRYLAVEAAPSAASTASPLSRFWLPPAFIPDAVGFGVVELARQASRESGVARRFAELAADRLLQALWRFADQIVGPPDLPDGPRVAPGDVVHWIVRCGGQRAIAVQLVPFLSSYQPAPDWVPAAVHAARASRRYPDRAQHIAMGYGEGHVEAGTEIVPLVVFASAGHIAVPQMRGGAVMSLDDLLWASTTADYATDLFLFCRDLADPGRPELITFEAINIWEWWRSNGKSLHMGALRPDLMTIAPHWGDAEWDRSTHRSQLERALAVLGLPPIQDWTDVDTPGTGSPSVYGWSSVARPLVSCPEPPQESCGTGRPNPAGWELHVGPVPVAVRCLHPAWPDQDHRFLNRLAGAFTFGLDQIRETWQSVHADANVRAYRIELEPLIVDSASDSDIDALILNPVAPSQDGTAVLSVCFTVNCEALATTADADITAGRKILATAMRHLVEAAGIGSNAAQSVAGAWEASPPTLAVSITSPPTSIPVLPRPWPLDDALVAAADQAVADAVRAAGVQPGDYSGTAAKALDRDTLAPAALRLLTDRLARHSLDDVLVVGMRQLDRCAADRQRTAEDIQRARRMTLSWDPVVQATTVESEHLRLRRSCETAIEAALRTQPTGSLPLDQLAWMEVIAAAAAYLEATTRSEAVHHQVSPTALTITDSFAIKTTPETPPATALANPTDLRAYTLDVDAYRRARTQHLLGPADQEATPPPTHDGEGSSPTEPSPPVPDVLDAALRTTLGASGTDILTVLFALARWPLEPEDDHVVTTTHGEALQFLLDTTILSDDADGADRIKAALALLTSTTTQLQAVDWKPWHARSRQRRLLTQPLVEKADGSLLFAPHFCLAAMTVYINNLQQGMLPWTQPPPPSAVDKALAQVRNKRNRALEDQVATALAEAGLTVQARIKQQDPQRLGVPSLSGEIDVVAGQVGSPLIWLLEVKDPADVVVIPEIRRHLDTFYRSHNNTPAYASQLQRKLNDLAPHAERVAAALPLPPAPDGRPYEIRSLFVTRRPIPAAFIGADVQFTTLDNVVAHIGHEGQVQR